MSVSGDYFVPEDFFSPARFNRKVITHLTGAQIAALSPTYPNQLVVCSATGSGFVLDQMYRRNTANTAWISGGEGAHDHSAQTDAAGGLFSNILLGNLAKVIWEPVTSPTVGQFNTEASVGQANDTATGGVTLTTGAVNGQWVHISRGGVGLSFASRQIFIIRLTNSANTFLTSRLGVYAERVDATGTATPAKYGLEVCDSAGTARTWDVFSADGTARSVLGSSADVTAASATAYKLDYTPGTNVRLYVNGFLNTTKSTNVPASGSSTAGRTIGAGVKTNNATGKTMVVSGMVFTGVPSTTAWA